MEVESGAARLAGAVWERLRRGRPLDPLQLGLHDRRVDLRGFQAPGAVPTGRRYSRSGLEVAEVRDVPWLKNVRLEGIDFSQAQLVGLCLERCELIDCRFDDALIENWRLWGTRVVNCTFRRAKMRGGQLGTVARRRVLGKDVGTVWSAVDFSEADMRGGHAGALFEECTFSQARLDKFDFGESFLRRCRFAGELEEVEFSAAGWRQGAAPVETLCDVDFRQAILKSVMFRRLNLDQVQLPDDDEHLIVNRFPCVLERALDALRDTDDPAWLGLRGLLEWERQWLGPRQEVGVIHISMLDDPAAAVPFLRKIEADCEPQRRHPEDGVMDTELGSTRN